MLSLGTLLPLAQSGGEWLVPMLLVFVIFYFIVIRPASRERKAREAQVKSIKKHDRVVTNAGIHGTVVALEDDAVVLRVDDKADVRMLFPWWPVLLWGIFAVIIGALFLAYPLNSLMASIAFLGV